MTNKNVLVKNRSAGMVVYRIPEEGVRREFQPGEAKKIDLKELEKLTYQPGGRTLMANFLQIKEEIATQAFNIERQPEYEMSEQQVVDLIREGSLDAFLDALDFAPLGVIDLIKMLSVQLPISDPAKREALYKKTGFDVDKAIANEKADKEPERIETIDKPAERRVKPAEGTAPTRRRTTTNYKVVGKAEE
jgi:hypothetical protein